MKPDHTAGSTANNSSLLPILIHFCRQLSFWQLTVQNKDAFMGLKAVKKKLSFCRREQKMTQPESLNKRIEGTISSNTFISILEEIQTNSIKARGVSEGRWLSHNPSFFMAKHSSCRYFQFGSTCLFRDLSKKRPGWLQICSLIIWNKASTPTHTCNYTFDTKCHIMTCQQTLWPIKTGFWPHVWYSVKLKLNLFV